MPQSSSTGRSRRSRRASFPALTPIAISLSFAIPSIALAAGPLPQGGRFVAGYGSINGNATSLTITQISDHGVIDWNSFSIGSGNHVDINNGKFGATLNRVTGAAPSAILGSLSAAGSVYLINPQGIVIGRGGVISTGGRFVASTLDTDDTAFMNGSTLATFSSPGATATGTVVNLGKIATSGGDVFLIASKEIDNVGSISAPNGTAELAVGKNVLLRDSTQSQQVFVQQGSAGKIVNRGAIEAEQINLQAADGNIFALAGNHSVLRATGTALLHDGHVWLVADTGRVWLDGTVEATDTDGSSGATVDTNAAKLRLAGGPTVTANRWNITTSRFTIDGLTAPVFQSSLNRGTSIDLQTTGAGGARGDIDVASSIQWNGAASLTLGAHRSLTIEAATKLKNAGSGNLKLRADAQGMDNGASLTNNGTVDWSASQGSVGLFYDRNGTYTPGTLLANTSWTSPAYSGIVTQITGYQLVNSLSDLKNVANNLAGTYALGRDIDASATSDGSYVPLGSGNTPFTGQFDGENHRIGSLTIQGTAEGDSNSQPIASGLFGTLGASAVVRDLDVNGTESVSSKDFVSWGIGAEGILAAYNYGTISHVFTGGRIDNNVPGKVFLDSTSAGGLVGVNYGKIERSVSAATTSTGGTLGELAGVNYGVITQSDAAGLVVGVEYNVGIGGNNVVTEPSAGGLVGLNMGTITQSYFRGDVINQCYTASCSVGGLAYANAATISESFVSGAFGRDLGTSSYGYGIAVENYGTIANNVYWDTDTTGATVGVRAGTPVPAANGLTLAQMGTPSSFAGYDLSANGPWYLFPTSSGPILRWEIKPPSSPVAQ